MTKNVEELQSKIQQLEENKVKLHDELTNLTNNLECRDQEYRDAAEALRGMANRINALQNMIEELQRQDSKAEVGERGPGMNESLSRSVIDEFEEVESSASTELDSKLQVSDHYRTVHQELKEASLNEVIDILRSHLSGSLPPDKENALFNKFDEIMKFSKENRIQLRKWRGAIKAAFEELNDIVIRGEEGIQIDVDKLDAGQMHLSKIREIDLDQSMYQALDGVTTSYIKYIQENVTKDNLEKHVVTLAIFLKRLLDELNNMSHEVAQALQKTKKELEEIERNKQEEAEASTAAASRQDRDQLIKSLDLIRWDTENLSFDLFNFLAFQPGLPKWINLNLGEYSNNNASEKLKKVVDNLIEEISSSPTAEAREKVKELSNLMLTFLQGNSKYDKRLS